MSSNISPSPPTVHSPQVTRRDWRSVLRSALPGGHHDLERPEFTPVLAAGALLLVLVVQLLIPSTPLLPDGSALAPRRPHLVAAPALPAFDAILRAPIFSPDRKPGESDEAAPGASALDGFVPLGVSIGRGFASAVLKGPDGNIRTIHVGARVLDWRLVGIESSQLTFERDTSRRNIPVGKPAAAATTNQNGSDE